MKKFYSNNLFYCLLLVVVSFTSCNGQVKTNPDSYRDESKTITDGQARKSRGLVQDKTGNFWFSNGTNDGVTVYNGKTFANYTEKDGLSSNFVWTILEDNEGKLWFGTADGVTQYDGQKFTIIPIISITGNTNYHKTKPDPTYGFPEPEENWVMSILQDKTGVFWFGTSTGVYRYDGKTYSHFSFNDVAINNTGVPINNIESILQDNSGNIWFGGRKTKGVFRYDGKTLTNFKPDGADADWVYPLLQDKSGNIWFSKKTRGLFRFDGKTFKLIGEKEFSDFFFSMEEDNSGNFWFGNGKNSGVTFYDEKSFINYTGKDGLCDVFMRTIVKDKDGNIWFNCKNNGLCRYDGKTFTTFAE